MDLKDPALNGYRFGGSIGPLSGTPSFVGSCPGIDCTGYQTSAGAFNFSSVSMVTFTIKVGAATAPPAITKIVDIGAFNTRFAPGMPIEITGTNLGTSASDPATITVGGKPLPILFFVNSSDVVAQIPVDTPLGTAAVVATYKGAASAPSTITIDSLAPEILVHADTGSATFYDFTGLPITASHPASANSQVYLIAVGLGTTIPPQVTGSMATILSPTTLPVQLMIGNKLVTPDYAGLFVGGLAGTYKILFKPPVDVAIGSQPVVLTVGGKSSNTATLIVGPPVPVVSAGGVVSGGLSVPAVKILASNAIATVFGQSFAPAGTLLGVAGADLVNGRLPTKLDGVCVYVNNVAAPLFFLSATQINFQVPQVSAGGNVGVQVAASCGTASEVRSGTESVSTSSAAAEFFYFLHSPDGKNPIAALNAANGSYIGMPGLLPGATFIPASPGDILTLFFTGGGNTNPQFAAGELPGGAGDVTGSLGVMLAGAPVSSADILYAGVSPGFAGLYQLNLRIPMGTPSGNQSVILTISGQGSPAGYLFIGQ